MVRIVGAVVLLVGLMLTPSPAWASPALLLRSGAQLDDLRARLRAKDAALAPALAALEEEARKALAVPAVSVMDKGIVPPSGDKHDYMSQAPYWWADPSKPGGRPYVRRDGERNPEIKQLPDHDNLGRLNGTVSTLGLAFYLTGNEEYAAHAARLVRVWFLDPATRMRPNLNFGQGVPGINDGRGIGIIETRGLPDLLDGVTLLAGSPSWTAADQQALRAWMAAYLTWLTTSRHGRDEARNGNNHETWYDVQVAALATWTGQPRVAAATFARAKQRIARQIQPDGRQPKELERTNGWHYSIFNLTAFFALAGMSERAGVDLWTYRTRDGRSLRAALDYLVPFAAGDRPWPAKELSGFEPAALEGLLRGAATAWHAPAYAALADRIGTASPAARARARLAGS